jgi:hypothetical protein
MGHLKRTKKPEKPNDYADFRTGVSTSEFDFCRAKSGLELFLAAISAEIGDPGRVAL